VLGVAKRTADSYQTIHGKAPNLTERFTATRICSESLTGMEYWKTSKILPYLAFIIDEYGEVQGIVTLQDVMEAITGEFSSPSDMGGKTP
jgi:putative hemolysin